MKRKLMTRLLVLGRIFIILLLLSSTGCGQNEDAKTLLLGEVLKESPRITGKANYLKTPYVTAGDRVYMVGHQDGSFPDLGWHIDGEMGGIWNHPVKLMDGFQAELLQEGNSIPLQGSGTFVNYPVANTHKFLLEETTLEASRTQFVPDGIQGLVVEYLMHNPGEKTEEFTFRFTGHTDLRPTWLGEKTGMNDGQDEASYLEKDRAWLVKDRRNPWFVMYGSKHNPSKKGAFENTLKGQGASNYLDYHIRLESGESESLVFYIAGSYQGREEVLKEFNQISFNPSLLLEQKRNRYEDLAKRSKLTIPDKNLQQTFEWLKYNCDWLVRNVPEIGTGIMAGIPDYPWWFGVDSEYALKGYMAIGQQETVYKTIELLDSISNATNGNGRIVHEVSTNGFVFNKGNINETPQFASLIWEVYRWNGDLDFLKRYFPTIEKGLDWLLRENDKDGNLFPEGFGMMEIHGLDSEMIDVASYTQRAFTDASKMALALGRQELSKRYSKLAEEMKTKINQAFWSKEFSSYADFIGTDRQALHLIDDAIVRADTLNKPWAVEELRATRKAIEQNPSARPKPFVVHHNWVVNTPLEMGIADLEKGSLALVTAERFVNPFGVFVTGIDRDESAGSDDGSFKGSKVFSYTGAVMTLPTGVQAVAENNYGRPDEALNYLERMARTFSYALPGSMYEVSPDYGMITQAWNIYSFAVPIVQQFFGIRPDASKKEIHIRPRMPKKWNEASLEEVLVAENKIDVYYHRTDSDLHIKVVQSAPGWKLILEPPQIEGARIQVLQGALEGTDKAAIIVAEGKEVEVRLIKKG
jgi:glycogen debranching enzyme